MSDAEFGPQQGGSSDGRAAGAAPRPAPEEGPLAHTARAASERAYVEGMADGSRVALARASGAEPELASKRLLVSLSHAIEKAVMSGQVDPPTVVIALFQELRFFDRERAVYERMAQMGIHVVLGFIDGDGHRPPEGVHTVLLSPDEPLAQEWTVVAGGPRAGAFLVATDQHRFDAGETNLELSRQFRGRWGFSRAQGTSELARLRLALGDRLNPDVRRTIDELLATAMPAGGESASSAGTGGEMWATTALHHMLERMHSAQTGSRELRLQLTEAHQATAARAASTVDPDSGLPTQEFLQRWVDDQVDSELPLGLALFSFPALAEVVQDRTAVDPRDGTAAYYAARQIAAALSQPLGPVDTVVRLSPSEFLVVVPGASPRHLAGLCDAAGAQIGLVAAQGFPQVDLTATAATIVTRSRPLPLPDLRVALNHLVDQDGPIDVGLTPAGEAVTVVSTRLYTRPRETPLTAVPGADDAEPVAHTSAPATEAPATEAPAIPAQDRREGSSVWWNTGEEHPMDARASG